MKILITGGVKSGKSRHAEMRILEMANGKKPVYLATTELLDPEMEERVLEHRRRRGEKFRTIEEPLHLTDSLLNIEGPVLIECLTMWINNMLYHQNPVSSIYSEVEHMMQLSSNVPSPSLSACIFFTM